MRLRSIKTRLILRVVAAVILIGACANSERTQARALLEGISTVDPRAPLADRAAQIAKLRTLALSDPALIAVRDRCTRVHAGLLAPEQAQADARVRLSQGGPGKLPDSELAAITAAVAQAGRQLNAAQGELSACEHSTRELALHTR
jgi:hypothetical protein